MPTMQTGTIAAIKLNDTTKPSNPAAGENKIYFKSGTMYKVDSAGTETAFSTGIAALDKIKQIVNVQTGAVATGTTTIPLDDTIPQNTEGTEFMTLAITPTSATTNLLIDVTAIVTSATSARSIIMALFQDTTADALAVDYVWAETAGGNRQITLRHKMTSGTTSATTFKVRIGANSAATLTFNGEAGARKFGGVMASSITITEYAT